MRVIVHRGTREIGGSCVEVATTKTRLIVDLGMPLVAPWNKAEKLETIGYVKKSSKELLDLGVLPSVRGLYAMDAQDPSVDAVLLSHPHQDHYGLLSHIRSDVPVYLSDGANRLIAASDIFLPLKARIQRPEIIADRKRVIIGDLIITPYLVDHSGFGAMAFLIEGESRRVFYSGDFRGHGRKWQLFPKFLRNPPNDVSCLLMEGTTLGRPGKSMNTEEEVERQIVRIGKKWKGLKLVYASGQNIDRLVSFYKAARKLNGFFIVDLYTAYVLDSLGHPSIPRPSRSFPQLRVLYTHYLMRKIASSGMSALFKKFRPFECSPEDLSKYPGSNFVMYRASLQSEIEKIGNFQNAVMIYSMYEGYQHEASFQKVQKFLTMHGIGLEFAHTSGHAGFDDLKRLVEGLKPKVLTPIHTFESSRYKELWPSVHPLDDGDVFEVP